MWQAINALERKWKEEVDDLRETILVSVYAPYLTSNLRNNHFRNMRTVPYESYAILPRDDLCSIAGFERIMPTVNDKGSYSYSLYDQQKRRCRKRSIKGPDDFDSTELLDIAIMERCEAKLAKSTKKEHTEFKRIFTKGKRTEIAFRAELLDFRFVVFGQSKTRFAGNVGIHVALAKEKVIMDAINTSAPLAKRRALSLAALAIFRFREIIDRKCDVIFILPILRPPTTPIVFLLGIICA